MRILVFKTFDTDENELFGVQALKTTYMKDLKSVAVSVKDNLNYFFNIGIDSRLETVIIELYPLEEIECTIDIHDDISFLRCVSLTEDEKKEFWDYLRNL